MRKCDKEKKIKIILTVMIVIFAIITVLRSFYTVDITDESFIYAETLLMLKGNIPYAINATDVSGMCFLILPFAFIYKLLVPSLTGIVLFLRICFSVLRLLVIYFVYRILKKKNETIPSLLVSLLLTVWYYFTNYFSYNSNSIWLLVLISVWLYDLHMEDSSKKTYIELFITGCLSAFAVFAHPFAAVPVFAFVILLFIFVKRGYKIRYSLAYCSGGIFVGIVVLAIIVIKTSLFKFYSGLRILSIVVKQSESFDKFYAWGGYFATYGWLYLIVLLGLAIGIIVAKKREVETKLEFALCVALIIGVFYSFIVFVATGINLRTVGCYFGSIGILLSFIAGIAKKEKMFAFISLPFFLFLVLELSGQRNGAETLHPALAVPTLIAVILVVYKNSACLERWMIGIAAVAIAVQFLYADVIYSYRDDPITSLHSKVEDGVYKGLITSEQRSECLPELERWINDATADCDSVMFRDNVPFAYLMYKGHTPELQAWDMLNYSAGWKKNAKIMYNNFKNRDEFPQRIIYIDFGYDDCLSIETEWEFNDWVNSYYDFVEEEQINEMFRAKIYDYNGTFDGDYSKWTNF